MHHTNKQKHMYYYLRVELAVGSHLWLEGVYTIIRYILDLSSVTSHLQINTAIHVREKGN